MHLRYLFLAHYSDGTSYWQTPDDTSKQDPLRSCFYDVDHSRLTTFEIQEQVEGGKTYAVDLKNGAFYVNGAWSLLHDEDGVTFEQVIFARRHVHNFIQGSVEVSHTISWVLGWRGKDKDGNPIKRVMEILD